MNGEPEDSRYSPEEVEKAGLKGKGAFRGEYGSIAHENHVVR